MKISMSVNTKSLEVDLKRTVVRVRRERRSIVKREAEAIMTESLQQVPRDTNTLANSAFVEELSDGSYAFGYKAAGQVNPKNKSSLEDYMVKQHEDLSLNHPNGGKAKFLEDPMNEHASSIAAKMAKRLQESIFKGK